MKLFYIFSDTAPIAHWTLGSTFPGDFALLSCILDHRNLRLALSNLPPPEPGMAPTHKQKSYTTTLSTPELSTSPHLPALYSLISLAFDHALRTGYKPVVLTEDRLLGPAQILEEIGCNGFCILAFTSSGTERQPSKLVATVSAKLYTVPGAEEWGEEVITKVNRMFKRSAEAEKPAQPISQELSSASWKEKEEQGELPTWEILAMAVDPEVQGPGIASRLLDIMIEEIQRRIKHEQEGSEKTEGEGKVKILLSTAKELNESYYLRKVWSTTGERRFEASVCGSEGVVDMVKVAG